ncbi:MAG: glutathione-disulfide reductase [Rhodobacteraceae bacterium]|nr:glutathione-disulfide reductase [Paracoccaceae bacterium]
MAFDYDLFVIGGGSGGVRAGRMAAQTGAKVGLAEEFRYGGTCVIRGCVPKKLMVYASGYSDAFEDAKGFGWSVGEISFDWASLIAAKDAEIDRLEGIYRTNLQKAGVALHDGRAVVTGPQSVRMADGTQISARIILIATGGHPFTPDIPGAAHTITSDGVFHLSEQPRRILINGGGYIACEFACIFNGMGSAVTQYYRGEQILRGFDGEVRRFVAEEMREKGIDVHCGTEITGIEKTDTGLQISNSFGHIIAVDCVLMATGRLPNTVGLGLEDAGVNLGHVGEILVDSVSRTSVDSIYAIGDVTNRVALTPVAIREGMAFVETAFRNNPTNPDHDLVPTAVFTRPEIGTVGLSEETARANHDIDVYATSFRPMQHILAGRDERMLMKLLVEKGSRKVLGCHIVGPGAGEMIQLAGIAVKMGATKTDFDRTCAVHPTAAEELVTMSAPVR